MLPKVIHSLYSEAVDNDMPDDWKEIFKENKEELLKISDYLNSDSAGYLPNRVDVFAAFKAVPLHKVKVVLLGQDVYHSYENDGTPTSIGRAFATRRGYKVAPSLKNLYIELNRSLPNFIIPNHGDLHNWEKQGVLLLNTCLTVIPHVAESHIKINLWNKFMVKIFEALNAANPNCVYILLGNKAQAWIPLLGSNTIKLCCSHPSPFSFRNTNHPCYGSDIFIQVNTELEKIGLKAIDWNID